MTDPVNPPAPAPVIPPTPPPAGEPPPASPPAKSAAEIENEILRLRLDGEHKDKDLAKLKRDGEAKDRKLSAALEGLKAAGLLGGTDEDPKALVEKQQKDARAKERRDFAVERAAMKKLIPTGLGEEEADLILGKALRDPRVVYDETTGTVSGLDDVFKSLKPAIELLSGKVVAPPPAAAPPAPPNPSAGATPPDSDFAAVKTARDFLMLPASLQEKYEAKYPAQAKKFEADFKRQTISPRSVIQNVPVTAAPARR